MNRFPAFATIVEPSSRFCLLGMLLNRVIVVYRGADGLIEPHGGALKNTMVTDPAQKSKLLAECEGRKIECSDRNACDVELLTVGGFSPLDGFMNEVPFVRCLVCGDITDTTVGCWIQDQTTSETAYNSVPYTCLEHNIA